MRFVANMLPLWNKKIRNIIKNNWLRIFSVDRIIELSDLKLGFVEVFEYLEIE